ncbi:MAG TPA: type I-C CRISPR-associated endonuclease Cas1c [Bryobacteraceae bacterium]|nr:type I-C CRISPR-associated endonuclease Cas1c [Bryobacteraceae bacterium]
MEIQQSTLYVMTQGAYLHRDHLTVVVEVNRERKLGIPLHNLESVVLFGNVMVSPGVLELCAGAGVAVSFLSEGGRLLARVDAPVSGNVLLRREQFRQADSEQRSLEYSRAIVAGKVQNARANLMRAARDNAADEDQQALQGAVIELASMSRKLEFCETRDEVRGTEGAAARSYFGVFPNMVRQDRPVFAPKGRTRRPPLDRCNALLSFLYALLLADCSAALSGAGLDPNVGFLHHDRPGRPSLGLDLMEEFRPMVDRLVLTLINRRQVAESGFTLREGGAVEISAETRRAVIAAWQQRKQEQVTHPLLQQSTRVGLLPHLQARILARAIRGEAPGYMPCMLK